MVGSISLTDGFGVGEGMKYSGNQGSMQIAGKS